MPPRGRRRYGDDVVPVERPGRGRLMRAALLEELGRPPEPREVHDPAGDGVLVEVLAVPLNPLDLAVGSGRFYGGHPPLPYVPGCEGTGRVAESGEVVWVHGSGLGVARNGTLAERISVPKEAIVPVPEGADPALAAALGIAGLAGWAPLAWRAPVREGDSVLVLGATGTVGLVAVQAARLLGAARVIAAGRDEAGLERARRLGADAAVRLGGGEGLADRLREASGGDGPTYVLDPLWGEPLAAATEAAAPGCRIVHLGQSAGPQATLASGTVRGKQLELYGYSNFALPREVLEREYRRLVEHAVRGEVEVEVERVPLERVAEAWRRQAGGAGRKLVIAL
jgi:NADPH:quinone reductase